VITGFAVRNFKNLVAIPPEEGQFVPFGPLNVLIGPNGCGKSSLLQAIDFLRAFFQSSIEVYLQEKGWGFDDLPSLRQDSKRISWHLQAELDRDELGHGAGRYDYSVSLQPRRYLGIGEECLEFTPADTESKPITLLNRFGRQLTYSVLEGGRRVRQEAQIVQHTASFLSTLDPQQDRPRYPEALRFRDWVERFQLFQIWDPKTLRQPSVHPDAPRTSDFIRRASRYPAHVLGASGENLASALIVLKERHPTGFEKLVRRVRQMVPTFTGLEIETDRLWASLVQKEDDATYNSRQMSDGILRLLAVTLLLYMEQPPSVVLFEEPENGIHPQLLKNVVQILREVTQRKRPNRVQVFLTTHSPYVVDEFLDHPERIYAMERNRPGVGATITRLTERYQTDQLRDQFETSLGDAWVMGLLGGAARD
jgi:predicted ATPase